MEILAAQFLAGDEETLAEMRRTISLVAFRYGCDPDELIQETFASLLKDRDRLGQPFDSFLAWTRTFAKHIALRLIRRSTRERSLEIALQDALETAEESPGLLEQEIAEWSKVANDVIAALSSRDRHLLVCRFLYQWTNKELAAELGVHESTVSRRRTLVESNLLTEIRERGLDLPDDHSLWPLIGDVLVDALRRVEKGHHSERPFVQDQAAVSDTGGVRWTEGTRGQETEKKQESVSTFYSNRARLLVEMTEHTQEHGGCWFALEKDGSAIVAAAPTIGALREELDRNGRKMSQTIVERIDV